MPKGNSDDGGELELALELIDFRNELLDEAAEREALLLLEIRKLRNQLAKFRTPI